MKNILKFLEEVKVYDCNLTKIRIGNKHDGGYIALKKFCEKTDTVYSFGVENDVGFELDFVNKFPDAKVKLFDHTINSLPNEHLKFTFFKRGVGPGYNELKDIICNDTGNLLLKMDIEWDEWATFLSSDNKTLSKFNQLLIEFHVVYLDDISRDRFTPYFRGFYKSVYDKVNDNLFDMYYKVIKKLNNLFYAFHIHANNSLAKINVGDYRFPPLIELSFVRKDLVNNVQRATGGFPVDGLDYSNKPYKYDIKNFFPLGA